MRKHGAMRVDPESAIGWGMSVPRKALPPKTNTTQAAPFEPRVLTDSEKALHQLGQKSLYEKSLLYRFQSGANAGRSIAEVSRTEEGRKTLAYIRAKLKHPGFLKDLLDEFFKESGIAEIQK